MKMSTKTIAFFSLFLVSQSHGMSMFDFFFISDGTVVSRVRPECSLDCVDYFGKDKMVTVDVLLPLTSQKCPNITFANSKSFTKLEFGDPCENDVQVCTYCLDKKRKYISLEKHCKLNKLRTCQEEEYDFLDTNCYDCETYQMLINDEL